jgi:hypothetical protein
VFLTVVSNFIYSPAHGMHAVKVTSCILQGDFYAQLIIAGKSGKPRSNVTVGPGNVEAHAQNHYLTTESSSESTRIFHVALMEQISL